MRCALVKILAPALLLVAATGAQAQTSDQELRKEIEALKAGQEQIRSDLADIKKLLQSRQAPSGPNVEGKVFDLGENPIMGDTTAPLTLIEFTDYQCPFCSRHAKETAPKLVEDYIDTGKMRMVTLDFPLERLHPLAQKASEATHCAEEQGQFWEMHDRLFEYQKALEPWSAHAEALGMDVGAFEACLESGRYADAVKADMRQAQQAGATGTPSFVLAETDPSDPAKVKGLLFIRGAQPFGNFQAAIDGALEELD